MEEEEEEMDIKSGNVVNTDEEKWWHWRTRKRKMERRKMERCVCVWGGEIKGLSIATFLS